MSKNQQDLEESLRGIFAMLDKNNEGKILNKELGTVLRLLGMNPSESDIQTMIVEMDVERTGKIDFKQVYNALLIKAKHPENDEDLRDAFKLFDKENSGFVSMADFRHLMTSLGEKLSEDEFDEIMRELNIEHDGQIYYEDFLSIISTNK